MTDASLDMQTEEQSPQRPFFTPGTIFLIVSIVIFAAVIGYALWHQNQTQPTGGPAPNFELTTFDDQTLKLSDLRGKVVVLNFWASWCAPCEDEAPDLEAAWQRYADRGDVVFIGIAYADNGPRSMEFIQRYGITYLNGPDLGTEISEKYKIQGVPETFIIDQNGNIAQFIFAGVTERQLVTAVDALLAGETET